MKPIKLEKPYSFYAEKWGYSRRTIGRYFDLGCDFDLPDDVVKRWIDKNARVPVVRDEESQMKSCRNCREIKSYTDYSKSKSSSDGLGYECRPCLKLKYEEKNKEKINAKKNRITKNKGQKKQRRKAVCRKYYLKNKHSILAYGKKYNQNNNRKINERNNSRRKNEPTFKLKLLISSRIRTAIKTKAKKTLSVELLGCSIQHARQHLESKFKEGMSWDNHGIRGWHIDHIIPCDSFDLSDVDQQKQCFHYTNLQPLWYKDNLRKGNMIPDNHQPELAIPV